MSKRKKIIIVVIGLVIVLLIAGLVASKMKEKPIPVQTEKILKQDLVQIVSANGRIHPVTEVKISANISAEILELGVKEGDQVKKGDFLVRLDQSRYKSAVDQAEAAVRSARANVNLTRATMEQNAKQVARTKKLLEESLAAEETYELIETQYLVSKASYEAAKETVSQVQATFKQAQDELAKTVVHSPIVGTVASLNKEVGEIALGSTFTSDVIMSIADLTQMEAVAEVDENDIPDIVVGLPVNIEVDALPDTPFKGVVKDIARSATIEGFGTQEQATSFDVKVTVEGEVALLRPGMSATVEIQIVEKKNVLAVPIQCLTMRNPKAAGEQARDLTRVKEEDLKDVVFKITDDGQVKMVQVQSGISSDSDIEITGEIQENDEIVSGPYKVLNRELFDGDKVQVNNSGDMPDQKK